MNHILEAKVYMHQYLKKKSKNILHCNMSNNCEFKYSMKIASPLFKIQKNNLFCQNSLFRTFFHLFRSIHQLFFNVISIKIIFEKWSRNTWCWRSEKLILPHKIVYTNTKKKKPHCKINTFLGTQIKFLPLNIITLMFWKWLNIVRLGQRFLHK